MSIFWCYSLEPLLWSRQYFWNKDAKTLNLMSQAYKPIFWVQNLNTCKYSKRQKVEDEHIKKQDPPIKVSQNIGLQADKHNFTARKTTSVYSPNKKHINTYKGLINNISKEQIRLFLVFPSTMPLKYVQNYLGFRCRTSNPNHSRTTVSN